MRYKKRWFSHLITYPFLFAPLIPMTLTDLITEIYHRISFPLYGLPYIKRSEYIIFDRQRLSYLNWFQKIACVYCGYANGLAAYTGAIAGATEQYWCSIIHKTGNKQPHQKNFLPYGDEKAYRDFIDK